MLESFSVFQAVAFCVSSIDFQRFEYASLPLPLLFQLKQFKLC